jgi:hypothetical protein
MDQLIYLGMVYIFRDDTAQTRIVQLDLREMGLAKVKQASSQREKSDKNDGGASAEFRCIFRGARFRKSDTSDEATYSS